MMHCPECNSELEPVEYFGQAVDRCRKCGGVWFDESELSAALRQVQGSAGKYDATTPPNSIACPRCSDKIQPTNYSCDSDISILRCGSCRGVWLQTGQIHQLASCRNGSQKVDGLARAIVKDSNASRILERVEDGLRSRLVSSGFAILLLVVLALNGCSFRVVSRFATYLIFPMLCIWYADILGNMTGFSFGIGRPIVTERTPAMAVALGGWVVMLTVFVMVLFSLSAR